MQIKNKKKRINVYRAENFFILKFHIFAQGKKYLNVESTILECPDIFKNNDVSVKIRWIIVLKLNFKIIWIRKV